MGLYIFNRKTSEHIEKFFSKYQSPSYFIRGSGRSKIATLTHKQLLILQKHAIENSKSSRVIANIVFVFSKIVILKMYFAEFLLIYMHKINK